MPFKIIKGTFHVTGYSPDGDSIRFKALDKLNWAGLDGPPVEMNAREHVQLRIEAIDTLETHFATFHQPLLLAEAAMDFLLAQLGITNLVWNAEHTRVVQANDGTQGYILTRATEKNRRAVAFVYAGDSSAPDGSEVFLDTTDLKGSINHKMLQQGMAYPTYYQGLFFKLREELTRAAKKARQDGLGLWPSDQTNTGFPVLGMDQMQDEVVVLPKLFRRIMTYIEGGGPVSGFKQFLELDPDPVLFLDNAQFTHLDTFVEVTGSQVRLTVPPEKLVFIPL